MATRRESLWVLLACVLNELEANGEKPMTGSETIFQTDTTGNPGFYVVYNHAGGRWVAGWRDKNGKGGLAAEL